MYVTNDMIDEIVSKYGKPNEATFRYDVSEKEHDLIKSSQKHGRNHDVTLYIRKDDKIAVIAKPFYPNGLYRAPSGGIHPGETFMDGLNREVGEEVGIKIAVDKFILRIAVTFVHEERIIEWRSFIFTADYISGDFSYTDKEEISEVRLAGWDEFKTFSKIMRRSDIGGLHYRAALHDKVAELIDPTK